ncbi:hypothetical protein [Conexibacter sp. SYSU D00693]|uniref:hypothetical protein n=1 Tax=Conexibacter sp. SYSU D00693 TaxID=2812560 RepID=UPI00196A4986|nr:hypothetical protein [Conexibacter sp. SYSU D00693]
MTAASTAGSHGGLRAVERGALALAAVVAVAWTAVGLLVERAGTTLGTATPPFVAGWLPRVHAPGWLVVAAVVCALVVWFAPAVLRLRGWRFAIVLGAIGLAVALSVNALRYGDDAWWGVLNPEGREGRNEYLAALGALEHGPRLFLDRFAEWVPALPPHAAGHPPGLLLVVEWFGLGTPGRLATLVLGAVAVLGPLTWVLARRCGVGEERARLAGLLAALSPATVLFGATSADALFAALGLVAAIGLVGRGWPSRAVGAVALAVAGLFAWSLLAIAAWAACFVWRRDGLRRAVVVGMSCAVAFAGLNLLLAGAAGYDPIGAFHATEDAYRDSLARVRPYWFWWLGSPVAWAVVTGPVVVGGLIVAALRGHRTAFAIGAVLVIASVAGFTKAETERIWLPFTPLACVAAATVLPPGRARLWSAALVAEVLAVQVLFETLW